MKSRNFFLCFLVLHIDECLVLFVEQAYVVVTGYEKVGGAIEFMALVIACLSLVQKFTELCLS